MAAAPLISPLPSSLLHIPPPWSKPLTSDRKVVYGFLPYWNIKDEPDLRYSALTHLAFFGFDVSHSGAIATRTDQGYIEPAWSAYQSQVFGSMVRKAHDSGAQLILVLRAFDNDTIEAVLANPDKQQRLINETLNIMRQKNLDGINIDFEYVGTPATFVRQQFTDFVRLVKNSCAAAISPCVVSVDTYADAAETPRLWDLPSLGKVADHIIVMAYDFTRPSSAYSGPVAPLDEIKQAIAAFAQSVPTNRLVLGVPYYGYEWPTYSKEPESRTLARGYIATYKRIKDLVLSATSKSGWDDASSTPYIISTESGRTTQIFYDNLLSLALKYDFVNETEMAGIAIWALGYDGGDDDLWNLIAEKFPATAH